MLSDDPRFYKIGQTLILGKIFEISWQKFHPKICVEITQGNAAMPYVYTFYRLTLLITTMLGPQ